MHSSRRWKITIYYFICTYGSAWVYSKKIDENGYIRVERVGGVPEKALLSQDVVIVNNKQELIEGVLQ